jgi:DNA invertase Pin-like site-specific DNA recombinase
MNIAIYSRVSTVIQAKKGLSLDEQIRKGIELCEKYGYSYEIFQDAGLSGNLSISERPGLNDLFNRLTDQDLKSKSKSIKRIDGVFATAIDRLSRNEAHSFAIKSTLIQKDIKYFEIGGEKNLKDKTTNLMVGVEMLLANFERNRTVERVLRGLEESVIRGRVNSGSMQNYGYGKGDDKLLIIDEVEAVIVNEIFVMSLKGMGVKRICNDLNARGIKTKRMVGDKVITMHVRSKKKDHFIWRDAVVYRILTNSIYKGERNFRGKKYPSPIIVDPILFDSVQTELKRRKHFVNTKNKHFYLLKGLIICGKCTGRYFGKKRDDLSDNQYTCGSQRYKSEFCGNRGINIDKLNDFVWKSLLQLPNDLRIYSIDDKDKYSKGILKKIKQLEDKKFKNDKAIEVFKRLVLLGDSTYNEFEKDVVIAVKENEKITDQIRLSRLQLSKISNQETLINHLEEKFDSLKNIDVNDGDKQSLIRAYVHAILIKWVPKINQHIISIDFVLDNKSELMYEKTIEVKYNKSGWRFDENEIVYRFRKLTHQVKVKNEGQPNQRIEISENQEGFGMRLNDKNYNED